MMPRGIPNVKKGKPTWKPAAMLDIPDRMPGYRLKWCNNDRMNIQRLRAEGWETASSIHGLNVEHDHPEKTGDGHSLTSVTEYRELVLMALPEELGEARDRYFNEKADLQTAGLKRDLEKEVGKEGAAEVHGKIVIE